MDIIKLNSVTFLIILQISNVFLVRFVQIVNADLWELRIDNDYTM